MAKPAVTRTHHDGRSWRLGGECSSHWYCILGRLSRAAYRKTPLDHLAINDRSPPEAKIALFRTLFRGREDVFARRFESRASGKSGYSPACGNEWLRGICPKPRGKCAACQYQQYLPITDAVVRSHLLGRDDRGADFVMGVYPLLLDESCFFLAMDFDKRSWQEDVHAVLATCERLGVPAALERSRSGDGGHVWIFFDGPVPASLARRLGAYILTETMEHRPEIGLESYDRLFPNQDTSATGRIRKPDRAAAARRTKKTRQQCLRRHEMGAVRRPVGIPESCPAHGRNDR